jgi:DNA-3-methyladenine glycosylase II
VKKQKDLFAPSLKYLKKDIHLGAFVIKHGPITSRREHATDAFQSLAEAIIYQQLSGKAAATILKRFIALWPKKKPASPKTSSRGGFPTPEDVLKIKIPKLRAAGLSGQKASYLKDLAAKFRDGTINPKLFPKMTDEEIVEHVVRVKGIGDWTAHMFLMFTLHRPDVLPTGDLGIQKGFQKLFKLHTLPTPEKMEKLSKNWKGHRTLACMYLWRYVDSD